MLSHNRFERSTILFIGLIVFSFILTTVDVRASGAGIAGSLRDGAQAVASPVQRVASAITRPVVGFFDGLTNLTQLRSENDRLQEELTALQQQVDETEQLRARLRELEDIAGLEAPEGLDDVTARVFAVGPSDFDLIRRIDRGTEDGVVEGMAVIDESGLIGRIVQPVNARNATVRLIQDPLSRVGVIALATGEVGWVTGQGDGPLLLEMSRASEELQAGDLLVTGGGRYPPNLPVGVVVEDARAEVGFTLRTTVEPRVDFARVDFVKVLLTTVGDEPIEDIGEEERILEEPVPEEGTDGAATVESSP
jgi:rod shape-determining protein MreC